MTFGSDGATVTAPTDEMSDLPSVMLRQVCPPFAVRHTPPFTAPKYATSGRVGSPATATARPPRNGPTSRHRSDLNLLGVADGLVYSDESYGATFICADDAPRSVLRCASAGAAMIRAAALTSAAREKVCVCMAVTIPPTG